MDEALPYLGYPIVTAHPRRLAWTARVFGGPRPNLDNARVLEIGCGDGANLLSIAAFEPDWTLRGLDISRRAIAQAQAGVQGCRLANTSFDVADLAEVDVEPGQWDFVLAHGIYSWIDPARREALLRLIRRALASNGLAVVSFNAQPGWGVRGRIRDALLQNRAVEPRRLLELLRTHAPADYPWGQLLAQELDRAHAARPDYLQHEYLAEHNACFWVSEVARDAEREGLAWVGDSQFDLASGRATQVTKDLLGVEGLAGEDLADLITYRQFRSVVFARSDADRQRAAGDEDLLREAYVSGVLVPASALTANDWTSASQVTFQSDEGDDILVREPLCKMALDELARIYPDAATAGELAARSRTRLQSLGVQPAAAEERALREGIIRLWRVGALELRLHRPQVHRDPPTPVRVAPITRYEASLRASVSTPVGVMLNLSPEDQAALCGLDDSTAAPASVAEVLSRWGLWASD